MDMSQEPFHARFFKKDAKPQGRDAEFERICAVEMHVDMSQEPVYARTGKTSQARWHTLITPALTPTATTPPGFWMMNLCHPGVATLANHNCDRFLFRSPIF